jgi:cytochrome P450
MPMPTTNVQVPETLKGIRTPRGSPGFLGRLLTGPALPAFAARIGAALAAGSAGPWRIGATVLVAGHAQVREMLSRDLDFCIAPINEGRIDEVNGPFVLSMDRSAVLARERSALYRALGAVDFATLRGKIGQAATAKLSGVNEIDVVIGYSRPIAAQTASLLFGIAPPDFDIFMEVARAIFAHTFLNLSGDKAIEKRAVKASHLMQAWLMDEIDRRISTGELGRDMMGALLSGQSPIDRELARRTLGGMFVGSIDTTATCVAKIIFTVSKDKRLTEAMAADVDDLERMRGWCWEALRRWPHNPILLRQAATATSLGGVEIQAGDRVVAWTQAAMQDASAFPDPARLSPDRPQEAYLHFGGALHACAGRSINGFQIPLLVAALVRRGITSVGNITWAGPFPDRFIVKFTR